MVYILIALLLKKLAAILGKSNKKVQNEITPSTQKVSSQSSQKEQNKTTESSANKDKGHTTKLEQNVNSDAGIYQELPMQPPRKRL